MSDLLRLFTLMVALIAPAGAGEQNIEVDTNLICDTQQQVERLLALFDGQTGSAEGAIAAVNEEANVTDACVIATVAFRRGEVVATVKNVQATFDVIRVEVVGVYGLDGLERIQPADYFTLRPHEDDDGTVGHGER